MSKEPFSSEEPSLDADGKFKLRGAALSGSETPDAVDHTAYESARTPDAELHLDGEKDTLYGDGLDIEEEFDTWSGTDGSSGRIP